MSAASLNSFLLKLKNDLENTTSGPYRELVANRRPHLFIFDAKKVSREVQEEMLRGGVPISPQDKKVIFQLAESLKEELESKLKLISQQSGGKIRSTRYTLRFMFTSNTVTNDAGKYSKPGDVFQKIKDFYREPLKSFFNNLQDYLAEETFTNEETGRRKNKTLRTRNNKRRQAAGRVLNAGHTENTGVAESMTADLLNNLMNVVGVVADDGDQISEHDIKTDLEALGIDLSIVREDATDSHTIQLESAQDNQERGREIRAKKAQLLSQIKKAIKTTGKAMNVGEGLENLSGSDSLYEKKRKIAIKNTVEPFKNKKGVSVTSEDTKIKKSSNKKQKTIKSPKMIKGKKSSSRVAAPVAPRKTRTNKASAASQPLALVQEFNRRLPQAIIDNMGEPALNNVTGRFASSVRVIDIMTTPKGFPSIGYTYRKNPYQTFETGNKQGDLSRDPRKLIDKTIREIAVEFAMGRLFTRRL